MTLAPFTQPDQHRFNASLMSLAGLFKQHGHRVGAPSCIINNPPSEVVSEVSQKWNQGRVTPV